MLGSWVKNQKTLIDLERDSEIAQLTDKIASLGAKECQNEGLSILNLEIDGTRSALFGRCCIILQKMDKKQIQSSFKVGDEVNLYNPKLKTATKTDSNDNGTVFGLISKVTNFKIEMVVEDFDENCFDAPLRLDLRSNQKTHNKMIEAISNLENSDHPLVNMLFAGADQSLDYRVRVQEVALCKMNNNGLNESQINAIKCALGSPFVSLIHGPPGTGKTSTLTELILQAVQRDLRILVCAPSNIAVDTILARLAESNSTASAASSEASGSSKGKSTSSGSSDKDYRRVLNMVRLGHPARLSANIVHHSLDFLIEHDEGTEIVQDVRKEIDGLRKTLSAKTDRKKRIDYALRREQRVELRALCKEAKKREKTVVQRILARSNVVLSTCIGASSNLLRDLEPFDLVVIDEAAQGLEAACWVPLLLGRKCVLAGDHCQLPPTIKSDEAVKGGLAVTLFERIMKDSRFQPVVKLLDVQYRMNDLISRWASDNMYHGLIKSDESVAHHTLTDIIGSRNQVDGYDVFPVMLLVDTSGCGMVEELCAENGSHRNVHEAGIVLKHIQALLRAGVKGSQIGVITPYNGQLEILRNLILPAEEPVSGAAGSQGREHSTNLSMAGVEIKTIDGFQGGEKECIIISLVRSNASKTVGFLSDSRRINVAVTRAKRHVAVVCDAETCGTNKFIHSLLQHMEAVGEHQSAYEYLDTVDVVMDSTPTTTANLATGSGMSNSSVAVKESAIKAASIRPPPIPAEFTAKNSAAKKSVSEAPKSPELDFRSLFQSFMEGVVGGGEVTVTADGRLVGPPSPSPSSLVERRVLVFPSTLNSYQRMSCHDVATQMGLHHQSSGEGSSRFIEVSTAAFTKEAAISAANSKTSLPAAAVAVKATKVVNTAATSSKSASKTTAKSTVSYGCAKSRLIPTIPSDNTVASTIASDSNSQNITSTSSVFAQLQAEEGLVSSDDDDNCFKPSPVPAPVPWDDLKTVPQNQQSLREICAVLAVDANMRNLRVSSKVDEAQNSRLQSACVTEAAAQKKKKGDSKKGKSSGASNDPNTEEDDDDAFLNAAILQNQKLANLNQYRVGGSALPNHEREQNKKKLQEKLADAQAARKPTVAESEGGTCGGSGGSKKKVLKKPTPNFGGGKLGSK